MGYQLNSRITTAEICACFNRLSRVRSLDDLNPKNFDMPRTTLQSQSVRHERRVRVSTPVSTSRLSFPASAYLHWTDKRWIRRRRWAWREGAEGLGSACTPWRQLSGQWKVHNSMKHATDVSELSAAEPVTILGASADVKFDTGDKEESARARAPSPTALPLGPAPTTTLFSHLPPPHR